MKITAAKPQQQSAMAGPTAAHQAPEQVRQPAGAVPEIVTQLETAGALGHRFENTGVYASRPNLQVTAAGDRHEQEADRAAEHVLVSMASPNGVSPAQAPVTPVGGAAVQREAGPAAATPEAAVGTQGGPAPVEVTRTIDGARGGGRPLPAEIRQSAERVLGADLSGVRVHTDGAADRLNQQVNADAFTTGRDLFFRRDTYSPDTTAGKQLIAHELAHVVQQRNLTDRFLQRWNGNGKDKEEESEDSEREDQHSLEEAGRRIRQKPLPTPPVDDDSEADSPGMVEEDVASREIDDAEVSELVANLERPIPAGRRWVRGRVSRRAQELPQWRGHTPTERRGRRVAVRRTPERKEQERERKKRERDEVLKQMGHPPTDQWWG